MVGAIGEMLRILLALACLALVGGAIIELAAPARPSAELAREIRATLSVGAGIAALLTVAVRLI